MSIAAYGLLANGHYFGTRQFESIEPGEPGPNDDDKRAPIAFRETL